MRTVIVQVAKRKFVVARALTTRSTYRKLCECDNADSAALIKDALMTITQEVAEDDR